LTITVVQYLRYKLSNHYSTYSTQWRECCQCMLECSNHAHNLV